MLYYICISVSKNRQSGLSGLLSAGWHSGFGGPGKATSSPQPPAAACSARLPKNFRPCSNTLPDAAGILWNDAALLLYIMGGGLCFVCKNWAAACGAAVHCLD